MTFYTIQIWHLSFEIRQTIPRIHSHSWYCLNIPDKKYSPGGSHVSSLYDDRDCKESRCSALNALLLYYRVVYSSTEYYGVLGMPVSYQVSYR
jgi:hypothetical protein